MLSALLHKARVAYLRMRLRWVEFDISCMEEALAVLPAEIRDYKLYAIGLREQLSSVEAHHA
jgi:hypothetical protein